MTVCRSLMRSTHERGWTAVTGFLVSLGLFAAVTVLGPLVALSLFLAAGVLGVVLGIAFLSMGSRDESRLLLLSLGCGAAVGGLVVTVAGWGRVFGPWAFMILVGLVVTSPHLLSQVRRRMTPTPDAPVVTRPRRVVTPAPAPPPVAENVDFVVPDRMDDVDICLAWCSSYVALQRVRTAESRLRVVQMRALYLDDLERRNPDALLAWMASGARAAGDPSRFLAGSAHAPATTPATGDNPQDSPLAE
jgi:hypothetical protein